MNVFQYLPEFKGKQTIARKVYKNKVKNATDLNFQVKNGLHFYVPNIVENVSFELFINGIYEKYLVDYLVENIPQNGTFVDVGANIGAISIFVAYKRPDVTIHCFEASPRVFQYLKQNVEQNNVRNVNLYNLAVHKEENIQLNFYSPKEKFGKGSFANVFTDEAEIVKTINLDKFYMDKKISPDFIKIDVEGFEALIFESMENFLKANNNIKIIYEFVDWAEKEAGYTIGSAQDFLFTLGYSQKTFPKMRSFTSSIKNGMELIMASFPMSR
jgi:FkbM family methyltransferase